MTPRQALLLMAVLCAAACAPQQVPQAEGGVLVDDTDGAGQDCSVAISSLTVHAAYKGGYAASGVLYARSLDSGRTWPVGDKKTIDVDGVGSTATVAVGNTVYVAYATSPPSNQVRFARSDDSGGTWNTVQLEGGSATPQLDLVVAEPDVYILYSHWTGTTRDLKLVHSGNKGDNFGTATTVVAAGDAADPTMVGSGNNLYAMYFDAGGLTNHFISSSNGGANWSAPVTVQGGTGGVRTGRMRLSGNSLVASFQDAGGSKTLAVSTNQGGNWSYEPVVLPDLANGPQVALSGTSVLAAYDYTDGSQTALRFGRSDDSGATWSSTVTRMFKSAGNGAAVQFGDFVKSGNNLVYAFFDGSDAVFRVAVSTDDGVTW